MFLFCDLCLFTLFFFCAFDLVVFCKISPWVDNCIGEGNYKIFCTYLTVETLGIIGFDVVTFAYHFSSNWNVIGLIISVPVLTITVALVIFNVFQIFSHFVLITNGLTTNEQVNLAKYPRFRDKNQNIRNPYAHGCLKNWFAFCCGACGIQYNPLDIESAPTLVTFQTSNGNNDHKHHDHKHHNHNHECDHKK